MKIRKADEMEMFVSFKAMRISYFFLVLSLTVYCVYERIVTGELPGIPGIIWLIGVALFPIARLVISRSLTKDADDGE